MIGFEPVWKPQDHASFFTAAEGWGLFTQKREGSVQRAKIDIRYGHLRVRTLLLAVPPQVKSLQCKAMAAGKQVLAKVNVQAGRRATIQLEPETILRAGETLEAELR